MRFARLVPLASSALAVALLALSAPCSAEAPQGYYRQPTLHGNLVVFTAEGDLWKVPAEGGTARRLTTHPGEETHPALSPDGTRVAFLARYEGPRELYVMPVDGGRPERRTYGFGPLHVSGWTPGGEILFASDEESTLPSWQLFTAAGEAGAAAGVRRRIPLAQAADGAWSDDGRTLFFTRLPFQGSHTKRYKGGTAQQIWSWTEGEPEARPLTADYPGTSKEPMWWRGRVWFASDRDGTMNLWSMAPDGGDLKQHTRHAGFDVQEPALEGGRIVYRRGADLHLYDIAANRDRKLDVRLDSDLDQTRERWIDEPMDWLTSYRVSPDGDRVALTARGKVFVAPKGDGRLVQTGARTGVRYRDARFLPDGKRLLVLGDATGEVELWTLPADGFGEAQRLTGDGGVLRWEALPSPDGKRVAHHDKNQRLFVLDVDSGEDREIAFNEVGGFGGLAWSADSRWLAYHAPAPNGMSRIFLFDAREGTTTAVTSDRYDSYDAAWGPKGEFLYFLSDRNLTSAVPSPWGSYQPEPFLDKVTQIFHVALRPGLRSPFRPDDELAPEGDETGKKKDEANGENGDGVAEKARGKKGGKKSEADSGEGSGDAKKAAPAPVEIVLDGLEGRIELLPLPAGNARSLTAVDGALFWLDRAPGERRSDLTAAKIANRDVKPVTVVADVRGYDLSADGKKIALRKGDALHVIDAKPAEAKLDDTRVDLSGWALSVVPEEEWRQMFDEAWRLERDYFYDRGMHGVDWKAMRETYAPLLARVTTRDELADLMAQLVAELSALHIFVGAGDTREGPDDIAPGYLGARTVHDPEAGGHRVDWIYATDPDEPWRRSPLADPAAGIEEGAVILQVDGLDASAVGDLRKLLRHKAGKQVRLRFRPAGGGEPRDAIVVPISAGADSDLRYREWEYSRRQRVEEASGGEFGYVHLRAMGGGNFSEWARDFYPVFTRKGLIVDVRHNRGGNIDSWILSRLLRKAWMGWNQRVGQSPTWNMQYAFRGHVVALIDERTASDGEAFAEGFRRLGLGKLIGTRTWGGEIWLTSSNRLVDNGIATAAEFGVYGPEGEWLIEGWGVEPDIVVDNLPRETYDGRDRQLEAAIEHLKRRLAEEPIEPLDPPAAFPDHAFPPREDGAP